MTHATAQELEAAVDWVRASPREEGVVELVVRRPGEDEREVLEEAELDLERGLVGDRWADGAALPGRQLTLMNARAVELVARGRERWALAGNVLSLAAVQATLEHVLTDGAFARMIELGERFERGVQEAIDAHGLPWHVTRLGCRVEYLFRAERPVTGSDAAAGADGLLDRLIHLYALNRGILLTPFHNMALMSPATTEADVDRHTEVFAEAAAELTG